MKRLLVTGFGPFPLMPRNPSAALAKAVAASPLWRLAGIAAEHRILTTAYATLPGELDPLLASGPDAVLLIGVAGRDPRVRVEWRGTSRRSTLFPDVEGATATAVERAGIRKTRIADVKALRPLRARALPSRISRDAGRYLCNASYYRALALPRPVLFIHIPKPPRGSRRRSGPLHRQTYDERLTAALVEIAGIMLRGADRSGRPSPAKPA